MDSMSMDTDGTHVPIIPGLPDEISLLCLARVPRCHHFTISCVSKTWRALLGSQEFLQTRQKYNWQETWVYALCKDNSKWNTMLCVLEPQLSTRSWKVICIVPTPCPKRDGMAVETVGERLYLLGGCGLRENATDDVYCYNTSIFHWERVAPMPMARCYFVSASLDNKLFVTSGLGLTDLSPNSWDVYDPTSNTWHSHKNPMLTSDIVKFIAFDGKLYTIHKTAWNNVRFAGVYHPSMQMWHGTKNEIAREALGPTAVVCGSLFSLDESCGKKLMMWREESGSWDTLGRLSDQLAKPPCLLLGIDKKVYVVGKGFGTIVVFADKAVNGAGMGVLVCNSLCPRPDLMDLSILSCHSVTI
ncbi:F-box/kelch-repeat protein SKIP4 [Rhynchospora pubera]|uniref:F-box/kelch-repeat protein SKIP4 n=1 Tax=Rhynchospora pubera TaxID=906938 RepID=A0AAV8DRX0_9POAL|nr:F-box/kelch-repeat protein SKIP4 [Rhynchospora pubera]